MVDIFCGAGGFTEGFKKSGGFSHVFANDIDPQAIKTFSFNHSDIPVSCIDIALLNKNRVLELTKGRQVDLIVGGPPCQGFSIAGQRIAEDPKNKLFLEYIRIVKILKPKFIIFENVVGLTSMQNGNVLNAILLNLQDLGFHTTYKILNTADYGVPQSRPRVIIIARSDKGILSLPNPTHFKVDQEQKSLNLNAYTKRYNNVKDAFTGLPEIMQGEGHEDIQIKIETENDYLKEIRGTRRRGKIYNHRATKHSAEIQKRYDHMRQGTDGSSLPVELRTKKTNFFRLSLNKPSRTVTCNFRTDLIHPIHPRGLTVREAARLQSFDDDYCFFGNLTRKAKYVTQDDQVGNAVPPLFAKALADHLKEIW